MQATSHLLMIEPVNFGFNAETAINNSFQKDSGDDLQQKALEEFNNFVSLLQKNKIDVTVVKDTMEPHTPDSIFPNNWISFHADGKIFLYPMFASNRRLERKQTVLDAIQDRFIVAETIDLSEHEKSERFLEGTGSLVLDRINQIAYACISPRTDIELVSEFCSIGNFTPVLFSATDRSGIPIYHTNVLMCMADNYVVICLDSVNDQTEREQLIASFEQTKKEIIDISFEQLNHFAGNMLQVVNTDGEYLLLMSTQAYSSLYDDQITSLEKFNRIVHSALYHIESAGGGSARCMMAEVFLQPKR